MTKDFLPAYSKSMYIKHRIILPMLREHDRSTFQSPTFAILLLINYRASVCYAQETLIHVIKSVTPLNKSKLIEEKGHVKVKPDQSFPSCRKGMQNTSESLVW